MRDGPVNAKRPANSSDKGQPETARSGLLTSQEVDPPEGVERAHWRLLTTHTVTTLEQARQIVAWYRMRWTIEQVFRSMKSNCSADRGFENGGCQLLYQTRCRGPHRCHTIDAACDGPRRKHQPADHRCRRSRDPDARADAVLNTSLEGAHRETQGIRMMKVCLRGTRGSSPGWAGGPAGPPADTGRRVPLRPCIMGCSAWPRSWPVGA